MNRNIDPTVLAFLETREPYTYAHLIQFERPIIANQDLDVSDKQFVYLTDASVDLNFNDPRVDTSPDNLGTKYRANRVINIPGIPEYSNARATSIDMQLDGASIGAILVDSVFVTDLGSSKYSIDFTFEIYDKGFVQGDKIDIEILGTVYTYLVDSYPTETQMVVKKILSTNTNLPTGANNATINLKSEELMSILQDKSSANYSSFINREVIIYKIYFDSSNVRVGEPYYLYKGIIQDVSIDDDGSRVTVNWTLNNHWGDFSEVKGRISSDESHRALDERGVPQPASAIKPSYAYDKGFIHADTAIHLEATYTVQVEKQDVKFKKGFFGIGAKVKVKKFFEDEDRQTELDFQLQGKTLDVVYGVRPMEGSPIFADTENADSSQVYVAYALCEGEIGGLYDIILQDNSLICNNEQDFDTRSTQTEENNVDVVCYGRADRGDVLSGVVSTNADVIPFYGTDLLTYANIQNLSWLTNTSGYVQPLATSAGSVGILHENSVKLTDPIDMTIDFYSGRSNQRAAPNLVDLAKNINFKIQNDYWVGNKMEYWGPNHRLLDTAYVVNHYTISENETQIPVPKYVIKGSFISCYNYDYSYQQYSKATGESEANFSIGDLVDLYDSSDLLIHSNIRIIDKFQIRNNQGVLETRFRFDQEPSLGYADGIPSVTKFYMSDGVNDWTMVTHNYIEEAGALNVTQSEAIASVTENVVDNSVNINLAPAQTVFSDTPIVSSGGGGSVETFFEAVRVVSV